MKKTIVCLIVLAFAGSAGADPLLDAVLVYQFDGTGVDKSGPPYTNHDLWTTRDLPGPFDVGSLFAYNSDDWAMGSPSEQFAFNEMLYIEFAPGNELYDASVGVDVNGNSISCAGRTV